MVWSVVSRGVQSSGTGTASSETVGPFTPRSDSLVIAGALCQDDGPTTPGALPAVPTGTTLTFTTINAESENQASNQKVSGLWRSQAGASPGAETVTWIGVDGSTMRPVLAVVDITGHDSAAPVVQQDSTFSRFGTGQGGPQSVTAALSTSQFAVGDLVVIFGGALVSPAGTGIASVTVGGNAATEAVDNSPSGYQEGAIYYYEIDGTETDNGAGGYDVTVNWGSGGVYYYWSVHAAVLADGGGLPPAELPGAPTALSATPGSTSVGLSWTAPADDGGDAITDYVVEYALDPGSTEAQVIADDFNGYATGTNTWAAPAAWEFSAATSSNTDPTQWKTFVSGGEGVLFVQNLDQVAFVDTGDRDHGSRVSIKLGAPSGGNRVGGVVVAVDLLDSYKYIGFELVLTNAENKWLVYDKNADGAGFGETILAQDTAAGLVEETWYDMELSIADNVITAKLDGVVLYSATLPGSIITNLDNRTPEGAGIVHYSGAPNFDDAEVYSGISTPTLSWQTFADGVSAATGATVTGLTNLTAYAFRVAAVNSVGQGPYSTIAQATTLAGFDGSYLYVGGTKYRVRMGDGTKASLRLGSGARLEV